jgi:hypothetical protein
LVVVAVSEQQTPRIRRCECGICDQTFTDDTVVGMAQSIARHWNDEHGDEFYREQPFKTEEFGGHHLHGDEYAVRRKEYYITAYDVLDKSGSTVGPFAYQWVKEVEGEDVCSDCARAIRSVNGYREIGESDIGTKYRCDECERERTIERRKSENESLEVFARAE